MANFLVVYHVPSNAGYAIELLEQTFFRVVSKLIQQRGGELHLGYSSYKNGKPKWLGDRDIPLLEIDYKSVTAEKSAELIAYFKKNDIQYVLAFDLGIGKNICKVFRKAGIRTVITYWGAPVSSLYSGPKLLLKRLEVLLNPNKPSHFIFESFGMQKTATHGRGIRLADTSVVKPGIDLDRCTRFSDKEYVYNKFSIPRSRKIFFYAGHMEERKGVHIIVQAAAELVNVRHREDVHFLICGNRDGEKEVFDQFYKDTDAQQYISFGGYRSDIAQLMPGCFAGIVASTGWDSHPLTTLEMAASGLPIVVSDLLGLNETVESGVTGLLFTPGDYSELADKIEYLVAHPAQAEQFGENGRQRIKRGYTSAIQEKALFDVLDRQFAWPAE